MSFGIEEELDAIERAEEEEGIYEGQFQYGEKHGLGGYLWHNGNFYNGQWAHGKIQGEGTLFYANGGILKGHFEQGKLAGVGRGIYGNGDTYVGSWRDGKFDGQGLFYARELDRWQFGSFLEGNMTHTLRTGAGKLTATRSMHRMIL